jgi:hypothetical protein
LPQTLGGRLKIYQPTLGSVIQHAQRPRHVEMTPSRLSPSRPIVDQDYIGTYGQCEADGFALARP